MHIEQTSEQVGPSEWTWAIWLEPKAELAAVDKVVYHLHPTFAKPIVTRRNRTKKFRLDARGWGTFVIGVEIHKTDGSEQKLKHRLRFSVDEPRIFVSAASTDEGAIDAVRDIAKELSVGVASAEDSLEGEDLMTTVREKMDKAKAVVLINGKMPSRWVMQEVEIAKSLGKPIVSIGENNFYDFKGAEDVVELPSLDHLGEAIDKLRG